MRKFRIRKADGRDYRAGNFVFHEEADYIKVSDISGACSHRVSKMIVKGRQLGVYLEDAVKGSEDARKMLEMYAVVSFNVLCTAYDVEMLARLSEVANGCMNRHKELYGMKDEVTEESEREDLEAVRETEALDAELRSAMEGVEE